MNYFFALELPNEVRQHLAEYANRWRKELGEERFRWYVPADYHITLKFLGDLRPDDEARSIAAALHVAQKSEVFSVQLAGPSALPDPERFANVLINGIRTTEGHRSLVQKLEQAMSAKGFEAEKRPYNAHVTFARCKKREQDISFTKWEHVYPVWKDDHFVLMQTLPPESRAKDSKARYNIVHTFPFGGHSEL